MPSFPKLSTEADFRAFIEDELQKWIRRLETEPIAIRIPKLKGLLRLLPDMHFHLRAELFLQVTGKTFFEFPEEKFTVGPGEICIVPKGMPHKERIQAWRGPFLNLVFTCTNKQVAFHVATAHPRDRNRPHWFLNSHVRATPCLTALLDEAGEFAETQSEAKASGLKGIMIAYFSLILAEMQGWTPPSNPEPSKVRRTRQLVIEQLHNPDLSVAYLARQVQCSADYLSQLFRKATDIPLSSYINENRLARARELLALSALNIAEVSQAAGFYDPSYFTRLFRRTQGMTPSEYRNDHT